MLNELNREDVIAHLAELLLEIGKLYQIPNWTVIPSVALAGWILREYGYEQLGTITKRLQNPPVGGEKVWRLTPDVIQAWLAPDLQELAVERERNLERQRDKETREAHFPESEWEDERLTEWLKEIEKVEAKKIPSLTQEDILKEGQEKPYVPKVRYSTKEEHEEHERKLKWMRECTDLGTGRIKKGSPTYEEWLEKITK